MGGGGVVASTPSHPLVRRRVEMTKSVTANCVGVGSTKSVLQDWSVTSPTPYYIIWWLTFMVSTNLYKLYVFQNRSAFKYLHNQIITAWHSRKTESDFPEEMSHQIGIVIKSWGSRMISLNQSKLHNCDFFLWVKFTSKVCHQWKK